MPQFVIHRTIEEIRDNAHFRNNVLRQIMYSLYHWQKQNKTCPIREVLSRKENNIKRSLGQPVQIRTAQMKQKKQTKLTSASLFS